MSDLSNNNLEEDMGVRGCPPEDITTLTLDDEFDRKKRYMNACGFDDATLRRRDNEMKELQKLYPDICVSWLELCWNYCEMTPKEEQDRIIKEKLWEKKPTKQRQMGGTIKNAMTIESRDESTSF